MPKFSHKSKEIIKTCHSDIGIILNTAIKYFDIRVIEGIRATKKQQQYFRDGKSKLDGVIKKSKHQGKEVTPEYYEDYKNILSFSYDEQGEPILSFAVDVAPYPIDWSDKNRFYYMGGMLVGISEVLYEIKEISHKLRWGGDWDRDGEFKDQSFHDLPHLELYK